MAKKGFIGTIVTACAVGAAVGTACYVFRDKIKESKVYKELDLDDRLERVKYFVKEHFPITDEEEEFLAEDEFIFEDDKADFSTERNYVTVDITPQQNEDVVPTIPVDDIAPANESVKEPEKEQEAEPAKETEDEDYGSPLGYDMEGLSDVSEDPEALRDQYIMDQA